MSGATPEATVDLAKIQEFLVEAEKAAAAQERELAVKDAEIQRLNAELASTKAASARADSASDRLRREVRGMVIKVATLFDINPDDPDQLEAGVDAVLRIDGGVAKLASEILHRSAPAHRSGRGYEEETPPNEQSILHSSSFKRWIGQDPSVA